MSCLTRFCSCFRRRHRVLEIVDDLKTNDDATSFFFPVSDSVSLAAELRKVVAERDAFDALFREYYKARYAVYRPVSYGDFMGYLQRRRRDHPEATYRATLRKFYRALMAFESAKNERWLAESFVEEDVRECFGREPATFAAFLKRVRKKYGGRIPRHCTWRNYRAACSKASSSRSDSSF